MNPWIKRIALALGALLLVLLAAAAWLVSSFDAERTKTLLSDWMLEHRDRTLAIEGPLELRVFPRLEVALSQVSLSEKGRPDEFLHVDEAALSVEVLPLLRRQLRVDRVELAGMRLRWTRDAKGASNIDDLLSPAPDEAGSDEGSGALDFDIAAVKLRDVRLLVADAMTPLQGEVQIRSLDTGRLAAGEESPVRLAAALALKEPKLAGELTLDTRLRLPMEPGQAQAHLALRELALGFRGEGFGVQDIDLQLAGALERDGASGALQAQDLKLTLGAAVAGLQLKDSTLALARFDWAPQQRAMTLERLALQLKGAQDGQPLSLALDWPQLKVAGDTLQGSPLSGRLSLAGEQPLQAEFKSGAPSGSFEQLRLPGFQAKIGSDGSARRAHGTLGAELLLQPARQALALEQLALQLNLEDPQLQPLSLQARGRAQVSAQAAQWQLGGRLNEGDFRLDGRATWAASVPDLRLQGEFATLDLNRLLPPQAPAPAPAAKPQAGAAADAPVDLSALRSLQAGVSLKAGRLVLRQFDLKDARLEATLDAGMLRVSRLAGGIWGGSIDAQAGADARAQRVTLRGTARGIQLEPALKALADSDQLEGTGTVTLDVQTAGRSVGEMKSALAGSAAVQVRDGAVKGINLARTLRSAKAALSMREDATQKASQTEKTDFSELTASFRIAEGVARNQDLDVKSPFLRIGGEGAIDIGRDRLDYTVRATVASTSKGQDGAELAALRGLTVPVQLSGPLAAPDWRIRWSGVAAGAAQASVKNRLEDKLRERLGGGSAAPAPEGSASQPQPQPSTKELLKEKLFKELFR